MTILSKKKSNLVREVLLESDERPQKINLDDGPVVISSQNNKYAKLNQDKKGRVYVEDLSGRGGFITREEVEKEDLLKKRYFFPGYGSSKHLRNGDEVILGTQNIGEKKHSFCYFERQKSEYD